MSKKTKKKSARRASSRKRPARDTRKKTPKAVPFAAKDFLTIKEWGALELETCLKLAEKMKKRPEDFLTKLKGRSVALLFQKPSMRTRVSFEVGMHELGGTSVYMDPQEMPLGERESIKDVARVLSRYCDAIVTRTYSHADAEEMSQYATVPLVNGLSDLYHPCQALADLFTLRERFGDLSKVNLAYVGDGNNVLNSLLCGAAKTGLNLSVATPRGYEPNEEMVKEIQLLAKESGSKITISNNPFTAIKNSHAIYTDVWVSMGQEKQREQRLRDFQPFQVNSALVNKGPKDAIFMHCLPAHRGEEISDEVMESPRSAVFSQAENRLHTQKALLYLLLTRKKKR